LIAQIVLFLLVLLGHVGNELKSVATLWGGNVSESSNFLVFDSELTAKSSILCLHGLDVEVGGRNACLGELSAGRHWTKVG
jgi:hypothetical protein